MRSAAQMPISHKRIFHILPIFRTHFSHVISHITFHTFAFRILQITITLHTVITRWRGGGYIAEGHSFPYATSHRMALFRCLGFC